MTEQRIPARLTLPGRILAREIEARGWTQKDLASIMGRPAQAINEIIKGTKQITPETSLALADVFGTSAEFWLNLEANYRLNLARREQSASDVVRRSRLYSLLPIAELRRRGWITATASIDEMEQAVCRFLDINSLNETPALAASFRQASERTAELNAQIAWLARVRQVAESQEVANFDREKLRLSFADILTLSARIEDVAKLPELLASLGIHFVIVQHLPKTYIDGATFMLNAHPVVAISLRFDRIDCFWFTLIHELAHVVEGHQGLRVDNLDKLDEVDVEEQAANRIAGDCLIPSAKFVTFIERTRPHFGYSAIERFANSIGRHPGIISGRLQRDKLIGYDRRKFLEKVSPFLQDFVDPVATRAGRDKCG